MSWTESLERLVEEIIALTMVFATITFIAAGYELPEAWVTAFGMIIAFYFRGKAIKGGDVNG